jgi:hypothetical protein
MGDINSQMLQYGDVFLLRASTAGTIIYRLFDHSHIFQDSEAFRITVTPPPPGPRIPQAHGIEVTAVDLKLRPSLPTLTVVGGDILMWHSLDPQFPPIYVKSEGGSDLPFDSRDLTNGTSYKHLFGTEGTHHWKDLRDGTIKGAVHVRAPSRVEGDSFYEYQSRWSQQLASGTIITIDKDKVDKPNVSIAPGQSVFWAVGANKQGLAIVLDSFQPPEVGTRLQDVAISFYRDREDSQR